jgi:transcriptional regulator with XRE-family HTH domain
MCDHTMWGHDPAPPPPGTVTFVIGVRIDADRLRRKVQQTAPTLRECAAVLDVPETVLAGWFAGRSLPQPPTLHRILNQLRVDLAEVLPEGTPVTLEVLRWRAGMTRQDAARAAHMSRPRYAALEDGTLPATDRDLAVLATALHATEDELHAATRRYPEVSWVLHVPTDTAEQIDAAREAGESRNDAALRLWRDGLAARRARPSPDLLRQVREILWQWDPLDLTDDRAAGAPIDDEYDDLIPPVLTLLRAGAGPDVLAAYLRRVMVEDYGLSTRPDPELDAAADRLVRWWPRRHDTDEP